MSDKVEAEERQLFEMFTSRERLDYRLDHEGRYASAETFDAFKFFRIGLWSPKISPSLADREALVQHMVNRFLQWRLPENFNPDGGISFKKTFNENTPHPMKHEPVGTNLLDVTQAEEMVRYMLDESPSGSAPAPEGANGWIEKCADEMCLLIDAKPELYRDSFIQLISRHAKLPYPEALRGKAKLPAPEGMGRDADVHDRKTLAKRYAHEYAFNLHPNESALAALFLKFANDCTSRFLAHPTSESGTITPWNCPERHYGIVDCESCGLTFDEQPDFPAIVPERLKALEPIQGHPSLKESHSQPSGKEK